MFRPNRWLFTCLLLSLAQCNASGPRKVSLRISVPPSVHRGHARSVTPSDIDCVFVNVVSAAYSGFANCWQPGTYSQLAQRDPNGDSLVIKMDAAAGAQQSIEVLGFKTTAATPCSGAPSLIYPSPDLYRYGHLTADIKNGATVDIYADSTAGAAVLPQCAIPSHTFAYSTQNPVYPVSTPIATNQPLVSGLGLTGFMSSPAMPTGLTIDATTGAITGTPTVRATSMPFLISAHNATGEVFSTTLKIQILGTDFQFVWPQAPSIVETIAMDGDQILVGGDLGTGSTNLLRINADGTLDSDFSDALGTGFSSVVTAIGVQSDKKIIVGGNFDHLAGASTSSLVRLKTTGELDHSFSNGVLGITGLAIGTDDNVFVIGNFGSPEFFLYDNANDTRSTAYGGPQAPAQQQGKVVATRNDGRFLVGLESQTSEYTVYMDDSSGTATTGFNNPAIQNSITSIAFQHGTYDKYAIIGSSTGISRILPAGDPDNTFTPYYSAADCLVVQSDNKVVIAHSGIMARMDDVGNQDATFNGPTTVHFNGTTSNITAIQTMIVQPDDKIIVVGTAGGSYFLARFLANGLQDFTP